MPLPKPKLLAGWRRAKLIALINESYLSFRVAAPVGLWSTRLRCPQIHRLDLFVTRWPSTCDAQRNQNSEPKFRPPAVSKSLTRSIARRSVQIACGSRSRDGISPPAACCPETVGASEAQAAHCRSPDLRLALSAVSFRARSRGRL